MVKRFFITFEASKKLKYFKTLDIIRKEAEESVKAIFGSTLLLLLLLLYS
jgi:hypothetical protein